MPTEFLVVIPCLNEEATIQSVVRSLHSISPEITICVVDDGSIDATGEMAQKVLRENDIFIEFSENRGIAQAIKFAANLGIERNFKTLMQVDGDGQHPKEAIITMLKQTKKIRQSETETFALIGSRYRKEGSLNGTTIARKFGNQIIRILLNKLYPNTSISDPTSGLRVYSGDALKLVAENYPKKWPEPIFIGTLSKYNIPIYEIDVDMQPRIHGKSSLSGLKSIQFMCHTIIRIVRNHFN